MTLQDKATAVLVAAAVAIGGQLAGAGAQAAPAPENRVGSAGLPQDPPRVGRQEETGKVGFIGTGAGAPIETGAAATDPPGAVAKAFLLRRAADLGLGGRSTGLLVARQQRTPGGGSAVRLRQTHGGVPVLGGEFAVSLDADRNVLSVLGEASPIGTVPATPAVDRAEARRTAVAAVARVEQVAAGDLRAVKPVLSFYDPRLLGAPGPFQSARLAWVGDVRSSGPVTAIDRTVVVDAVTGTVALTFSNLAEAKDRIVCDAGNTANEYPCTTALAEWTEGSTPATADTDVSSAYEYGGDTYDFFAGLGRDSLDGAGMTLKSTVDYCPSSEPCPYQNAFWDGRQMVYGDGFASADDVVGHELTHGVTDFSSSLFYYMQSGAINESMSDVFGEYVDLVNGAGTDTPAVRWLLGEDLPGTGAIRDMQDPTAFGDPDRMLSPRYFADPNERDGGGVHVNSGVNNKAAYLITDGGTFNGQSVTGLGITKAARIYHTVNTTMLVSGSDYADLANALRQACRNLAGTVTDGITAGDCASVDKAVLATEMDQNPAAAPTTSTSACPSGTAVTSTILADDLESATGQLTATAITGSNAWYYPQNPNPVFDATYATSGSTNIWGYDRPTISDSAIRMTNAVPIPAGAFLHFNHAYGFEDDAADVYDGGVVEYSTTGAAGPWTDAGSLFTATGGAGGYTGTISADYDNPLAGRGGFVRESNGYGGSRADLSSLAGQSVMFRWRIGTDSVLDDYGWFLDDLRIVTCVTDDTLPETTVGAGPPNGSTLTYSTVTFAFASSEAGSSFRCRIDEGALAPCASPTTLGLSNGPHTFEVVATDAAGNVDPTPATRTFTVSDSAPPDATITSGPTEGSTITSQKARFDFAASEAGSGFICAIDGGAFAACGSPVVIGPLAAGPHSFTVAALDPAGNVDPTPATRSFSVAGATEPVPPSPAPTTSPSPTTSPTPVPPPLAPADTTAPQTRITKHPTKITAARKARFAFRATEAVTFRCKLDRRKWRSCSSPKRYKRLTPGRHTFRVYAIDRAGNTDPTPAVWKWRVRR